MNRLFLMYFLFFFALAPKAQNWSWAKKIGDVGHASGRCVTVDNFGNLYTVGSFNSDTLIVGSVNYTYTPGDNTFLIKTDTSGNVKWVKTVGKGGGGYATGVTTDSHGNIYMAGYFFGSTITFDTATLTNPSSTFMYIVKFDSTGKLKWAKRPSGTGNVLAYAITVDNSDNIFITGDFEYSPVTFGSYILSNYGGLSGMFIVKYDSNGNVLWAKDGGQTGSGVATDNSNSVYVSGYYNGPAVIGTYTLTNNSQTGYSDVYLIKYDSNGNLLWVRSAGSTGLDMAYSVAIDNSGNAYMTGSYGEYYNSSITFGSITLNNSGSSDIFIVKYDSSGNVVWARSGNSSSSEEGFSVSVDNNNVFVVGNFFGSTINFSGQFVTNAGSGNVFLVEYNSNGGVNGVYNCGSSGPDHGESVCDDDNGNAYITGDFYGTICTVGTQTFTNTSNSNFDGFFAKFSSSSVGIKELNLNQQNLMLYPNPLADKSKLVIKGNNRYNTTLFIYDQKGAFVRKIEGANTDTLIIEKGNLANGIYFFRLIAEGETLGKGSFIVE